MDGTGLDAHHRSAHYHYVYSERYRAAYAALHGPACEPARPHYRAGHPKLTAVIHTRSHLILGAVPNVGPAHDTPDFAPALCQAAALVAFGAVTADAGYDAEHCHRLCRDTLGIPQTAIALNRRMHDPRRAPRTPYRLAMWTAFPAALYAERQQAESTFSQHKRRLGPALAAHSPTAQRREQIVRVLTHNIGILRRRTRGFQRSR